MEHSSIIKFCKNIGCCDACCLRYVGLKNPSSYENVHQCVQKFLKNNSKSEDEIHNCLTKAKEEAKDILIDKCKSSSVPRSVVDTRDTEAAPPAKRMKMDDVCVSCLGVLQEDTWPEAFTMVQEVLDKKRYECDSIACALSPPLAALVRERVFALRLERAFPAYDPRTVTPLKEAWKWTFGLACAARVSRRLQSGALAPLLVTLSLHYEGEARELAALSELAPRLALTRAGVERALAERGLASRLAASRLAAPPLAPARPARCEAERAPLYLAGRYVKLSRELPQTPWVVAGRRVMLSSVQEIIFAPVAAAYGLSPDEAEHRLKLIAAGREDVDVRCLGSGRPFALEVTDAAREPSPEELARACELICAERLVLVERLVPIDREELALLKRGEDTKTKTYEALCVKLGRTDEAEGEAVRVSERDVARLNACAGEVRLLQRTPLRVLHRRPLLARARSLQRLQARAAGGALFVVRVVAAAGTYVKEWAHGELGRTRPALRDALGARADILALDVTHVDLPWPPRAAQ